MDFTAATHSCVNACVYKHGRLNLPFFCFTLPELDTAVLHTDKLKDDVLQL